MVHLEVMIGWFFFYSSLFSDLAFIGNVHIHRSIENLRLNKTNLFFIFSMSSVLCFFIRIIQPSQKEAHSPQTKSILPCPSLSSNHCQFGSCTSPFSSPTCEMMSRCLCLIIYWPFQSCDYSLLSEYYWISSSFSLSCV